MPVKTIPEPQVLPWINANGLNDSPKAHQLLLQRHNELRAFLTAIEDPSLPDMLSDDTLFATLLALALHDYGVKQKDLAAALSISPAQVGRWASGEHAPRAYARPQVIQVIGHIIKRALGGSPQQEVHAA